MKHAYVNNTTSTIACYVCFSLYLVNLIELPSKTSAKLHYSYRKELRRDMPPSGPCNPGAVELGWGLGF